MGDLVYSRQVVYAAEGRGNTLLIKAREFEFHHGFASSGGELLVVTRIRGSNSLTNDVYNIAQPAHIGKPERLEGRPVTIYGCAQNIR